MSKGSEGKPASGSQPGRPPADTPNRLVVRSSSQGGASDSAIMSSDTAAAALARSDTSLSDTAAPSGGEARPSGPLTTEIVGTTLADRYLVTRKVGQGGMGAVYEATHTLIGKRVAVKVLLEKYAQREAIVKRLKQEAQLASSVGNEHIIDITDFGTTEDGRTFVVMEFLEGESLAECLARETSLPEQRILRIVAQAANALSAAHAKGIVHRDIKPENLFLLKRKEQDFVKVVDFGISKSLRASSEEEEPQRLTQTGMVLGTPLYMSPEQARGDDELDQRVDVYALGVIMYEAATGRVPFVGSNYLSVISQVLNETPKPPRELKPELSEEFEAVVMKAMAKDVKERYASAKAMLDDVTAILEDPTHSTERARITGPRRKPGKKAEGSPIRYLVWFGGITLVIAAVVFTVTQLLKKPQGKVTAGAGIGSEVVATPSPPIDAALVAEAPDAAPATEYFEAHITTKPVGAEVFCDGISRGPTPAVVKVVKKDKDLECYARLEGFDDYTFKFNPLEGEPNGGFTFTLKKPPKGTPVKRQPPPKDPTKTGAGSAGSASTPTPDNKTGGEIQSDPYSKKP
ncbi:MAG: serine/threonine-protein kinase [Kofleriaceae bacterium]|nr:serine/threonine-protein kinase [Kofleriaceae bacterium]